MFRRIALSQFSELKRLVSAVTKLGLCGNKDADQHISDGSLGATKKLMITYRTVWCHVTEAIYLNARRRENFKPCMTGVHKFSKKIQETSKTFWRRNG